MQEVSPVLYLFAIVVLVGFAVLAWRAFGPESPEAPRSRPARTLGPDDDPDFLRRIDPGTRRASDGEPGEDPAPGAPTV